MVGANIRKAPVSKRSVAADKDFQIPSELRFTLSVEGWWT
jgi:hypothetical protein